MFGRVLAVACVLVLSGCVGAPEDSAGYDPVEGPRETPVVHVTCAEWVGQIRAERPEAGSAEWAQRVEDLMIPYVEGQSADEVIDAYIDRVTQWAMAGDDEIPDDEGTLEDCIDELEVATADSTDFATNAAAVKQMFDLAWDRGVYTAALGYEGDVAENIASQRDLYASFNAYDLLTSRSVNEDVTLTTTIEVKDVVAAAISPTQVSGTWALSSDPNNPDFNDGATLVMSSDGTRWVHLGPAQF